MQRQFSARGGLKIFVSVVPLIATVQFLAATQVAAAQNTSEHLERRTVAAELTLNRGIVLYEQGRFAEALAELEQLSPEDATAEKYIALCKTHELPRVSPASYACDAPDCGTPVGCGTDVCCGSGVGRTGAAKRWHLTVLSGYQYDSNVTLEPEFIGLGSGRDIEDSSWLVAAFGDYQLVQGSEWNLGIIGSAYSNQYFSANEFDAQDYMGGAYTNMLLTDSIVAGVRYEFHETLLDYSQFATQHRLVPNVTMLQGDVGHITAYYELDAQEFEDTPLVPAMDRSGETNSVGVTQAIYTWDGDGRVYFGYRYDRSDTDGTDFARKSNMLTGRVECPLGERAIFDCEYRHFWDDYDNANSLDFLGRRRIDTRSEARAGLQFIVNQHVSIRGDYTFINSNSNTANLFGVAFFDYNRHLFSTQFIYDF